MARWIILLVTTMLLFQYDTLQAQAPQLVAELASGIRTYQIAWSPDGKLIAAAGENGVIIFDHNLDTVTTLLGHNKITTASVAWHPNGSQLATGGGPADSTVRIWDRDIATNSFTFNRSLDTGGGSLSVLAWSPNGQKLAGLAMIPVDTGLIADLNIWSTVGNWDPQPIPEYVYIHPLFTLTWSFDSQYLALVARLGCPPFITYGKHAFCEQEGAIEIKISSGEVVHVNRNPPVPFSLAWSPVALQLASTSFMGVEFYEGITGAYIKSVPYSLTQLAWGPNGILLAGNFDGAVKIIDVNSEDIVLSIPFTEARSIQWSPDGRRLAVADLDGLIQIWQVELDS